MIPALDSVGKGFEKGTIFLPQLLMSAEKAAFEVIKEAMEGSGQTQEKKGVIILATVKGDIHDIGKNIVKVLLENYSYEVVDLGRDVPPENPKPRARAPAKPPPARQSARASAASGGAAVGQGPLRSWSYALPHGVDHALDVVGAGIEGDAMAEIEDMRPAPEGAHHIAGLAHQVFAAADPGDAAPDCPGAAVLLHMFCRPVRADRIVHRDAIGAGFLRETNIALARLAREGDDGQAGMARAAP